MLKESLIQENADYYNLLNDRFIDIKTKGTKIISIGGTRTKTKVKVVYSLHGETNESYPDLPISLNSHHSIKRNNFVYVIGVGEAYDNQIESNKAFRLYLNEDVLKWKKIASMNFRRSSPGVAMFDDTIVVCGSYNSSKHVLKIFRYQKSLSSTETYNATLNQWKNIECLNQGRHGNESAISGGCLYTMGGDDRGNSL